MPGPQQDEDQTAGPNHGEQPLVTQDEPYAGLSRLIADLAQRERLERRLTSARFELSALEGRVTGLRERLLREGADVARLERTGLHSLFYTVLGSKTEQLQKERQEHLAARLRHEAAVEETQSLVAEIDEIRARIADLQDLETRYRDLLEGPGAIGAAAREIVALRERQGRLEDALREIDEAREAGRTASSALVSVVGALSCAGAWGVWDMLGGGILATAVKHSRVDDARGHAVLAHSALSRFRRELADVSLDEEVSIEIGSFATFADYFFDGLIADWIVQSRIRDSEQHASLALAKVNDVLDRLDGRRAEVRTELAAVRADLGHRIGTWDARPHSPTGENHR